MEPVEVRKGLLCSMLPHYQETWEAAVGKVLMYEREPRNDTDKVHSCSKGNDYWTLTEKGVTCLLSFRYLRRASRRGVRRCFVVGGLL